MTESKLINLVKTFTKDEMKDFGKFISSPYFASGRNLKPLYNLLKKCYPEFKSTVLTEEKIFKKLYPGKKYEEKRSLHALSVLFSEMYVMAEKFLTIKSFLDHNVYKDILLLKELRERKTPDLFNSAFVRINKTTNEDKKRMSYFAKKYRVNAEKCLQWVEKKSTAEYLEMVKTTEESLIMFFLNELSGIIQTREMSYHKNRAESDLINLFYKHFDYKDFTKDLISLQTITDYPEQILIYSVKLDFDFNDRESYEKLKSLLARHQENVSLQFYYRAVSKLMNSCFFQNKDNTSYFKIDFLNLFESVMKKAIDEKDLFFLSNKILHIKGIYNYVKISIKTNQLSRLEEFIKTYSEYFQKEIKADAENFAQGYLEFAKGNFNDSLSILSKNGFVIPMLVKEIKMMKLKSCYELNYYEQLNAEIDTYRHFISSTQGVTTPHVESDKEFLKFLKRLSRIKENRLIAYSKILEKDIKELDFKTFHTDWLLSKIKEL